MGWGAEVLARAAEAGGSHLIKVKRLAAKEVPVPSSGTLEGQVLPDIEQIIMSAVQMIQ
jgi:pyruvate/2-oxoglutarate/acetoin dehydrogenase E1 component